MTRRFASPLLALLLAFPAPLAAQTSLIHRWPTFIGDAYLNNQSHAFLQKVCDFAGGRIMGSPASHRAMDILENHLRAAGLEMRRETFEAPCWTRGQDEVSIELPFQRDLRCAALGYVQATPEFTADVVYARHGFEEDYAGIDLRGRIALVNSESVPGHDAVRGELITIASAHGARAVLFVNDRPGGMTLSGSGNFSGQPTAIPGFSITLEDGRWLMRLLAAGETVRARIVTRSDWRMDKGTNCVVTIPGRSGKSIVLGGHFDSWDAGQGAVDNGVGSAVLFETARVIAANHPDNLHTITFVWFDGEELGLIGAKRYAETHIHDSIGVMINMDMTGSPTGFNVMGTPELEPFFRTLIDRLNGFDLQAGVSSSPWTNSDHVPFMLRGIPTVTPNAKLDEPMYKYYHDLGDTFDKVSRRYLSDAAAIMSIVAVELANSDSLLLRRRSERETIDLLKKAKIDERLKKQKEWIFDEQ